jgi:hypothetical protein
VLCCDPLDLICHTYALPHSPNMDTSRGKCLADRTVEALTRSAQSTQPWPLEESNLQVPSPAPQARASYEGKHFLVLIVEVQPSISRKPLELAVIMADALKLGHCESLRA